MYFSCICKFMLMNGVNICDLPLELQTIILGYLTKTKDIIRSTLVCKSWQTINGEKSIKCKYTFDDIYDVKCIKCNKEIKMTSPSSWKSMHDYQRCLEEDGYKFLYTDAEDEDSIIEYVGIDVGFFCCECIYYYVLCESCLYNNKIVFCRFLGFDCYRIDDIYLLSDSTVSNTYLYLKQYN